MNYISIEQSKHLLELGLSPESADACYDVGYGQTKAHIECENFISYFTNDEFPELKDRYIPCWSVGALLELMPNITIKKIDDVYYTSYEPYYGHNSSSLIDAVYGMMVFLLQNNYIKTE